MRKSRVHTPYFSLYCVGGTINWEFFVLKSSSVTLKLFCSLYCLIQPKILRLTAFIVCSGQWGAKVPCSKWLTTSLVNRHNQRNFLPSHAVCSTSFSVSFRSWRSANYSQETVRLTADSVPSRSRCDRMRSSDSKHCSSLFQTAPVLQDGGPGQDGPVDRRRSTSRSGLVWSGSGVGLVLCLSEELGDVVLKTELVSSVLFT